MDRAVYRSLAHATFGVALRGTLLGFALSCAPVSSDHVGEQKAPRPDSTRAPTTTARGGGVVGDTFYLVAIGNRQLLAPPPDLPCARWDNVPQMERIIIVDDSTYVDQSVERVHCRVKSPSPSDTLFEFRGVYTVRGDTLSIFVLGGGEFDRELHLSGRLTSDSLIPFASDNRLTRSFVRRPAGASRR